MNQCKYLPARYLKSYDMAGGTAPYCRKTPETAFRPPDASGGIVYSCHTYVCTYIHTLYIHMYVLGTLSMYASYFCRMGSKQPFAAWGKM